MEELNNNQESSGMDDLPKIGRNYANKRKNTKEKGTEIDLDNQDKKKHNKNNGTNLENIIQKWLEQQETRQIELDKKREEQRLETLKLKQQSDMALFGMLSNLTNCLNSLHGKSNSQPEGIY